MPNGNAQRVQLPDIAVYPGDKPKAKEEMLFIEGMINVKTLRSITFIIASRMALSKTCCREPAYKTIIWLRTPPRGLVRMPYLIRGVTDLINHVERIFVM
ncbi:unnamed protein product [Leptosia nina]|uniref:Uncharacterized protein n=1 Tax=Leptosia nina TaxID=320188 RepID=A0AAV1K046_9NEOP